MSDQPHMPADPDGNADDDEYAFPDETDPPALWEAPILVNGKWRSPATKAAFRKLLDDIYAEMDLEHLARLAELTGAQRVQMAIEMSEYARQISEAGKRQLEDEKRRQAEAQSADKQSAGASSPATDDDQGDPS